MAWYALAGLLGGAIAARLLKKETMVTGYAGSALATITGATVLELRPDPYYDRLYVDHITFSAENPSGSGVNLTLEFKAVLNDLSEVTLHTINIPAGRTVTDTIILVSSEIPSGKHVVMLRVYATPSAAPTPGFEPKVRVNAYGFQVGTR